SSLAFKSASVSQKVIEMPLPVARSLSHRYAFEAVLLSLLRHYRLTIALDDLVCLLRPTLSKYDSCIHECSAFLNLCQQVRLLCNERLTKRNEITGVDRKTTTCLKKEVARS